tara:strand:+ start:2123 stop:2245 length:123 start_codon:yes stop_codon:yes gene_type:complete
MSNQHNDLILEQLYQECLDKGMTEEDAIKETLKLFEEVSE